MALSLDIKTPDMGDWEKQTESIASNFEKIGLAETKASKAGDKLGKEQKASGVHIRKALVDHKKTTIEETKQVKETKAEGMNWKAIAATVAASAVGVIGLGVEILKLGHDASRSREGALSLINAFTEGHGDQTLKFLDQLARKLGQSVEDVRADWIAFNAAGMTNHMATTLVKAKADLMAMGQSAEQAQGAINQVLAAGHNNEEAIQQLEILKRAFPGIGDGAKAAAYAAHSFGAAMNELKDTADVKLAQIWDRVGPSLGKAARVLSDFITRSPEAKEAIQAIGDAIKSMAAEINKANLKALLEDLKGIAMATKSAVGGIGKAFGAIGFVKNIIGAVGDFSGHSLEQDKKQSAAMDDLKSFFGFGQKNDSEADAADWSPSPENIERTPKAVNMKPFNVRGIAPASDATPSQPSQGIRSGHTFNIYLKGGDDLRQDARTAAQEIQIRLQSMGLA